MSDADDDCFVRCRFKISRCLVSKSHFDSLLPISGTITPYPKTSVARRLRLITLDTPAFASDAALRGATIDHVAGLEG